MGAWGTGSFENDDALDWIADLQDSGDDKLIGQTFKAVVQSDEGYIEAPDGTSALAAAEVVAAIRGKPLKDLPEEVEGWIGERPRKVDDQVVKQAIKAVGMVRNDEKSELRELWDEAESADAAAWRAAIDDLLRRLEG